MQAMRTTFRCGRGFAVVTVVFVMTIFAVLAMTAVALLAGGGRMVMDEYSSQQAFNVAEAGVSYITKQLAEDSDWSDNAGVTKNFGPGSFVISYPVQSADAVTVRSDGTVRGLTRSIVHELGRGASGILAFDSAIYTGDDITMSGQAHTNVSGDVVAGGLVKGSGQARLDIAGDLATLDGVSTSGQSHVGVSGETTEDYEDVEVPTPDWDYWESHADHVINGNVQHGGQATYTYSGINYITGSFTVNGQAHVVVNGSIITRGGFNLSGQATITVHPTGNNPAVIAEDHITMNGQSTGTFDIDGWLFSSGDVNMSGQANLDITGGIVSGDDITINGQATFDVTYKEGPNIGFIGGDQAEGDAIIFGLWKETS